jgi:hypothetical protein
MNCKAPPGGATGIALKALRPDYSRTTRTISSATLASPSAHLTARRAASDGDCFATLRTRVIPDWQDALLAVLHFEGNEPIQFGLWPLLGKKAWTYDSDAVSGTGQAAVDSLPEPVTNLKLEVIDPHAQAAPDKLIRERKDRRHLVLRSV